MKKRTTEEKLMFAEAWVMLAKARFILVFFSFKKISQRLGRLNENNQGLRCDHDGIAMQVQVAIDRGSRYSPWRTKCFEQALAAKMMLKKRGVITTIFFGTYKNLVMDRLNAHAWLKCGDKVVTGGRNLAQYTVLSSFTD